MSLTIKSICPPLLCTLTWRRYLPQSDDNLLSSACPQLSIPQPPSILLPQFLKKAWHHWLRNFQNVLMTPQGDIYGLSLGTLWALCHMVPVSLASLPSFHPLAVCVSYVPDTETTVSQTQSHTQLRPFTLADPLPAGPSLLQPFPFGRQQGPHAFSS